MNAISALISAPTDLTNMTLVIVQFFTQCHRVDIKLGCNVSCGNNSYFFLSKSSLILTYSCKLSKMNFAKVSDLVLLCYVMLLFCYCQSKLLTIVSLSDHSILVVASDWAGNRKKVNCISKFVHYQNPKDILHGSKKWSSTKVITFSYAPRTLVWKNHHLALKSI